MKTLLILTIVSLSINISLGQKGWERLDIIPEEVVCRGSGKVKKNFIPPPANVNTMLKSASSKKCDIIVTYNNFPDQPKEAFEYAVNIWEQLIESEVPIYLTAFWRSMNSSTLASCGPTSYYRNIDNMYYKDRFYAIAIAEKIQGEEITESYSPDISASFNKNIEWYFGTDGNCPEDKYDFASTVLHEIAHGLGFTGFFTVDGNKGSYYDPPAIFDQFIANYGREFMLNTTLFPNNSELLYKQLVSNALFFRSPAAMHEGQGWAPRLYVPSTWKSGSSIYHLNDFTYPTGNPNSLMTHAAGYAEVIHDPGPLTLAMLADIGWKNMFIKHEELKDIETVTAPVIVKTSIVSDYPLDSSKIYAICSSNNFINIDTVSLMPAETETYFNGELPVNISKGVISYYFSATDKKSRTFNLPKTFPDSTFKLRIGPDVIPPTISHQHKKHIVINASGLNITANIKDNIAVGEAWLEYYHNSNYIAKLPMTNDSGAIYSCNINLEPLQLSLGDSIRYTINARDASSNQNIAIMPEEGYYKTTIEEVYEPLKRYITDFNDTGMNDFIHEGFEIKETKEFETGALHSNHPYESSLTDWLEFNFTSQLKHPIVLIEGGQMNYDEIVLVEPGEEGTAFGDSNFWDYVIIEGSKDDGNSWLPLVDGYDSRKTSSWEVEYNAKIDDNNNSTAEGEKEMFIRSNISLLENGNFNPGDTIFIRFRLYSDPFANGWGWVIDNLKIQEYVSDNTLTIQESDFRLYPNPTDGRLRVDLYTNVNIKELRIAIYNINGAQVSSKVLNNVNSGFIEFFDLAGNSPGMYLVRIYGDGQMLYSEKVIKK